MEFVRTASGGAFGGYRFGREPTGVHLMIADPFTFPAGELLAHLNQHVPGAVVMGGMASGGLRQRQSRLFLDGRVLTHGAVGAHLPRAEVHPLVAQGCRPVGDPYTITRADGNLIYEVGGRPPLVRLQELAAALARSGTCSPRARTWGSSSTSTRPRRARAISWSAASPAPTRDREPSRSARKCRRARPCSSTSGTPARPMRIYGAPWSRKLPPSAAAPPLGPCCSPALAAERACSPSRTTIPGSWLRSGPDPGRRILLRRRIRTGGRAELPAHLHRLHRAVPGPQPLDALQSASRPFGSGHLLGRPADPGQAGQGGAREDFADVM